jgi:hypothetical protein
MLKPELKVLFIIVGLLSAAVPAAAQSLKVPFAALSPTYAPLWIADQAGFFKKYRLDVQLVYISAGSVIIPAILCRRDVESIAACCHGGRLYKEARGPERQEDRQRPLWLALGFSFERGSAPLQSSA